LIQGGNVVWVVLAWIFGLFPSFLLPLFTPYFAYALLAWVVALLAYGLSGTLRQKRF
jgi:dolichyl-phosphate-mannose--protein O-mannosyl transferase